MQRIVMHCDIYIIDASSNKDLSVHFSISVINVIECQL